MNRNDLNQFREKKFIIIGGTSKAGTTSLYRYLSDHPMISQSKLKETGFFLDGFYKKESKYAFQKG